MEFVRLLAGFFGLGYFIVHGVMDKRRSTLERVTYGFLALPMVWMYLFFGFIILSFPVVMIMVLLEDAPLLGMFVLIGFVLVVINGIKNFFSSDDEEENNTPDNTSKPEKTASKSSENQPSESYEFTNLKNLPKK